MSTYNLVSRPQWNARPPTAIVPLNWSKVVNFIIHYSGAVRTQTVRSIQNFCMDNKGHSDIDYNNLVRGRDLFVGRGVNVGSHTLNNNSTSFGICIIGLDGDATDDDFRTVRESYDEVNAYVGRTLRAIGHNQAPTLPPGYTTCPGKQIQAWINAGMPYPNKRRVIDMFFGQVTGKQEIYSGDGVRSRLMPPGTFETTVAPLEAAGVVRLVYPTIEALLAGMGPLDKSTDSGVVLPDNVQVSIPPFTVHLA
jgi:hypothetical protein